MFEMSIPSISDEELKSLYERIEPVVRVNGKLYYLRVFSLDELRDINYLWNVTEKVVEKVKENELESLKDKDFVCLHSYGYHGYFKPSICEVLSQINKDDTHLVKAFEIIEYPTNAEDLTKDSFTSIAFANGYHVSKVRLYAAKK